MKKLLSIGVAVVTGLCLFCGCNGLDLEHYDDGSNLKYVEENSTGVTYTLEEAYENGFLKKEDIQKIAYYHDEDNEAEFPVVLSENVEKAVKNTFAAEYNADESPSSEATAEDFTVKKFLGYYYKCCVVEADSALWDSAPTDVPNYREEICGVKFHITNYYPIRVWMENKYFYPLEDAAEYGWLTQEDLKNIAYYYLINKFADNFNEENFYEKHAHLKEYKNFKPIPLLSEELRAEAELKAKQAFLTEMKLFAPEINGNVTIDEIEVSQFYGIYQNCYAGEFFINRKNSICGEPIRAVETVIGGVTFLLYREEEIKIVRLK